MRNCLFTIKRIVDIFGSYCNKVDEKTQLDIQHAFKSAMAFEHAFWVRAYENSVIDKAHNSC